MPPSSDGPALRLLVQNGLSSLGIRINNEKNPINSTLKTIAWPKSLWPGLSDFLVKLSISVTSDAKAGWMNRIS